MSSSTPKPSADQVQKATLLARHVLNDRDAGPAAQDALLGLGLPINWGAMAAEGESLFDRALTVYQSPEAFSAWWSHASQRHALTPWTPAPGQPPTGLPLMGVAVRQALTRNAWQPLIHWQAAAPGTPEQWTALLDHPGMGVLHTSPQAQWEAFLAHPSVAHLPRAALATVTERRAKSGWLHAPSPAGFQARAPKAWTLDQACDWLCHALRLGVKGLERTSATGPAEAGLAPNWRLDSFLQREIKVVSHPNRFAKWGPDRLHQVATSASLEVLRFRVPEVLQATNTGRWEQLLAHLPPVSSAVVYQRGDSLAAKLAGVETAGNLKWLPVNHARQRYLKEAAFWATRTDLATVQDVPLWKLANVVLAVDVSLTRSGSDEGFSTLGTTLLQAALASPTDRNKIQAYLGAPLAPSKNGLKTWWKDAWQQGLLGAHVLRTLERDPSTFATWVDSALPAPLAVVPRSLKDRHADITHRMSAWLPWITRGLAQATSTTRDPWVQVFWRVVLQADTASRLYNLKKAAALTDIAVPIDGWNKQWEGAVRSALKSHSASKPVKSVLMDLLLKNVAHHLHDTAQADASDAEPICASAVPPSRSRKL